MREKYKSIQHEEKIEQISKVLGFSRNDSEALLTHAAEVQTTDIIPLDALNENANVDSTTTTLNDFHRENTSAILDRDGPR